MADAAGGDAEVGTSGRWQLAMFKELTKADGARAVRIVPQRRANGDRRNWRSIGGRYDRTRGAAQSFTKFSHGPHLVAAAVGRLHALPRDRRRRPTRPRPTPTWNPHRFVSEFRAAVEAAVRRVPHGHGGRRQLPVVPQLSRGVVEAWRCQKSTSRIGAKPATARLVEPRPCARTSSGIRPGHR